MFPTVIVLPVEIFENFLDKGFHSVQFIFSYIIFWSLKARRKTFKGPASLKLVDISPTGLSWH